MDFLPPQCGSASSSRASPKAMLFSGTTMFPLRTTARQQVIRVTIVTTVRQRVLSAAIVTVAGSIDSPAVPNPSFFPAPQCGRGLPGRTPFAAPISTGTQTVPVNNQGTFVIPRAPRGARVLLLLGGRAPDDCAAAAGESSAHTQTFSISASRFVSWAGD